MNVIGDVTELIGKTPLIRLNRVTKGSGVSVYGKMECANPGGSVKDRICLAMLDEAEKKGLLDKDTVVIEPTSGNTGIGLAMICAVRGYRLILIMPDVMSVERRKILKAYGAELELTDRYGGMTACVERAVELSKIHKKSFLPQQFKNPANPRCHEETTAREILSDLDGKVDILVAGSGTGGTVSGVGRALKKHNSKLKVIALQPESSPVLSGGKGGPHKIEGIGPDLVPDNFDRSVVDEIMSISNDDAAAMTRRLAQEEGLLVGISAGSNVFGALAVGRRPENEGKTIVTILCDSGARYLSTDLFGADA